MNLVNEKVSGTKVLTGTVGVPRRCCGCDSGLRHFLSVLHTVYHDC